MITSTNSLVKNTSYRIVLPFYLYAALAFLTAAVLLLTATGSLNGHYFNPRVLAVTHMMALGWGTMIILGASHQLVPVLIEEGLYSEGLAYASFILAGAGIPLLVYGFYVFDMGWPATTGALLVNAGMLAYLMNLVVSILKSRHENVHAVFVFTAVLWLFLTTLLGLLLVFNFRYSIFPKDSLYYLSLHAHMGIIGWFLLLITGIGARLIPMFLISKHNDPKTLWKVYYLINAGLAFFILSFLFADSTYLFIIPAFLVAAGLFLFARYCYTSYRQRIRKQVDNPVKLSLLSVIMLVIPFVSLLLVILFLVFSSRQYNLILLYGFTIFFGWITAIILGMTFKTLPFIVWNKVYHKKAGLGKTPGPKDLFSDKVFNAMALTYLTGFVLFCAGILCAKWVVLNVAAVLLLVTALLYNWNVLILLTHKPVGNE
jgi:hypothetical protein